MGWCLPCARTVFCGEDTGIEKQYPNAAILVHPECKGAVSKLADKVASTAGLLKYAITSDKKDFIVATESGILHEMRKKCPEKLYSRSSRRQYLRLQ